MSRGQKKDNKDEIKSLPFNSKTHATLNKKFFVNLYAEDLYFLTLALVGKLPKFMITLHLNKILLKETLLL